MVHIQAFLSQIGALFANLFERPDWRNIVDIAILTVLIYNVIKLGIRTRANSLFKGIAVILVLAWISDSLQISALSWILQQIISMGLVVLVIVFQPELRRALDQIGRSRLTRQVFSASKRQGSAQTEQHVAELVRAINNMARKKIGALIVFERSTGLGDVIDSGTMIDGEISDPLIENIFEPNTPLHDGAMDRGRGVHIAAVGQLYHQSRAGHAPSRRDWHYRIHRRDFADRFGGDGHRVHGTRRQTHALSGRKIADDSADRDFQPRAASRHDAARADRRGRKIARAARKGRAQ